MKKENINWPNHLKKELDNLIEPADDVRSYISELPNYKAIVLTSKVLN